MRSRKFQLEKEQIGGFFSIVDEQELSAELIEVDEDGDLIVEINYSEDERDSLMILMEWLEDLNDED